MGRQTVGESYNTRRETESDTKACTETDRITETKVRLDGQRPAEGPGSLRLPGILTGSPGRHAKALASQPARAASASRARFSRQPGQMRSAYIRTQCTQKEAESQTDTIMYLLYARSQSAVQALASGGAPAVPAAKDKTGRAAGSEPGRRKTPSQKMHSQRIVTCMHSTDSQTVILIRIVQTCTASA